MKLMNLMKEYLKKNATQKKTNVVERGKDIVQKLVGFGKQGKQLTKVAPGVFEKVSNFIFLYKMY